MGFIVVGTYGCRKAPTDAEAIRSGITRHLTGLKTLNLITMDMDVSNLSIQGSQARLKWFFARKLARHQVRNCRWLISWKSATVCVQLSKPKPSAVRSITRPPTRTLTFNRGRAPSAGISRTCPTSSTLRIRRRAEFCPQGILPLTRAAQARRPIKPANRTEGSCVTR